MSTSARRGRVLVVTHPGGGTAGVFAQAAAQTGHQLDAWSLADAVQPARELSAYDALVVLGGGQNVTERERLPFLVREIELIGDWLDSGRPLLGVCLGAQLLAQAAGGTVERCAVPEIGWLPVERTAAGSADPLLGFGPARRTSYQWHSYAAQPPQGAVVLAESPVCAQAFRFGEAWGVQFHPEVTAAIVAEWTADWRADPDAVATGFSPERARAEAERELPSWMEYGRELFTRFLART